MTRSERDLEQELEAARRTIDALVHRVEVLQSESSDASRVRRALTRIRDAVDERSHAPDDTAYRALYESSPDPLLTVDGDGVVLGCNRTALEWLDTTVDRVVGRQLADIFHEDDAEAVLSLVDAGWVGVSERRFTLVAGQTVALAAAPVSPGSSDHHVTLHNVTTRSILDQASDERRRLLALAQFAGAMARELNDPMSIVQGRLELLLEIGAGDAAEKHVRIALDHARRISATLRNLRLVGHGTVPRLERVTISDALEEAIDIVGPRLREFDLHVDLEPPDLAVGGEAALYARVFANLFGRVVDLSTSGTRLEVRARKVSRGVVVDVLGGVADVREFALLPGGRVDSTFETGVGLSIAHTLVRSLGGRMEQRSAGGSTLFTLHLPKAPPRRVRARPVQGVLLAVGAKELANALVSLVGSDGFEVRWVRDAETALEAIGAEGDLHAVITELLLPGMSGLTLAEEVVRRVPGLDGRVLLVSERRISGAPPWVRPIRTPLVRTRLLEALGVRRRRGGARSV